MKTKPISDLSLAAFLAINGHKIIEIKSSNKKSLFIFQECEALNKDILDFYNRAGKVDPLSFSEMIRNLKGSTLQG